MSYVLSVVMGSQKVTAALAYGTSGAWGPAQVVQLGAAGHSISADVAVLEDGAVLVGPDVDALRADDPSRIVPRVIDRVGDPVSIVSGEGALSGQELVAQVVVWVAQQVADAEEADAQAIAVAVPAAWGAHRRSLLLDALTDAGLPDTELVSEPEAAVARYVERGSWSDTSIVAVVGIGASALRTAVVRGDGRDQQVLGVPDGYAGASGRAFDDAITKHVAAALSVTLPTLGGVSRDDNGDAGPEISDDAAAQLRGLCIEAKELLSIDTHVTIEPPALGGARVRVVRSELESLIRKPVIASVEALRRTVRSAGLSAEDIATVLLVGGSAQVPLVAEVLSTEFGRPVEVDPDPSYALALGAARLAGDAAGAPVEFDTSDLEEDSEPRHRFLATWRRPRKPAVLVAAACVLAVLSAGGLLAATADEGDGQSERPSRAVNLTTSPGVTPGPEAPASDPALSPASTDGAGSEGARGDSVSTAPGSTRAGATSSRPTSSATTTAAAQAEAPAPGSTAAVISPVTAAPPTTAAEPTQPVVTTPTSETTTTTSPAPTTTAPTTSTTTSAQPSDTGIVTDTSDPDPSGPDPVDPAPDALRTSAASPGLRV